MLYRLRDALLINMKMAGVGATTPKNSRYISGSNEIINLKRITEHVRCKENTYIFSQTVLHIQIFFF